MGIESIRQRDDGSPVAMPVSREDWRDWVSAGRTRNWMLNDPLIDWLVLYGQDKGYIKSKCTPGYDKDLDFLAFILRQGNDFEKGIVRLLEQWYEVVSVADHFHDIGRPEKAEETFDLMRQGVPVIHQGVLWDAEHRNYGSPDFLFRCDVLLDLFPNTFPESESDIAAPDLDAGRHYRVVDTKFATLHMNAAATDLGNNGSLPAYKAQCYVYNRMLGRMQGYEPPESYLLGRGWQYTSKGETYRYPNAFDRLGPVRQNGTVANKVAISEAVESAMSWVRRVRTEGRNWQVEEVPSVPELYPNMSNHDDGDMMVEIGCAEMEPGYEESDVHSGKWEVVKKKIAIDLKELTLLWNVGPRGREMAHGARIYKWNDAGLTPADVGVNGAKTAPVLDRIIKVNVDKDGPLVLPEYIGETRDEWYVKNGLEFFVDFEFCSDLNDDFSKLPEKGGQPLIFMIGCGHVEDGQWIFKSLVAREMTEEEELRIIREWVAYMDGVQNMIDPGGIPPRIYHWSPAEVVVLEKAYNSARVRHGANADWPVLNWYDFLQRVMRAEPVVVRGAMGFGLKSVANAMYDNGLTETSWESSPVDGLGAMVGAWRCDEKSKLQGVSMDEIPLMDDIVKYNEVDCRVMMEIVEYLRMGR